MTTGQTIHVNSSSVSATSATSATCCVALGIAHCTCHVRLYLWHRWATLQLELQRYVESPNYLVAWNPVWRPSVRSSGTTSTRPRLCHNFSSWHISPQPTWMFFYYFDKNMLSSSASVCRELHLPCLPGIIKKQIHILASCSGSDGRNGKKESRTCSQGALQCKASWSTTLSWGELLQKWSQEESSNCWKQFSESMM